MKEYFHREGCYVTELLNDPDHGELSVARIRVEPGNTTRKHVLSGISERYIIEQGSGTVTLDGINLEVVEGDVVRIPAETCQQIQNTGPNDLVFLAVCTPRYDDASYTEPPD